MLEADGIYKNQTDSPLLQLKKVLFVCPLFFEVRNTAFYIKKQTIIPSYFIRNIEDNE